MIRLRVAEAEAFVVLELTTVKLLVVILPVVVMLDVDREATEILVVKSDVLLIRLRVAETLVKVEVEIDDTEILVV